MYTHSHTQIKLLWIIFYRVKIFEERVQKTTTKTHFQTLDTRIEHFKTK